MKNIVYSTGFVALIMMSSLKAKGQTDFPAWERHGGFSSTNDNVYEIDGDNFGGVSDDELYSTWLLFGRLSGSNQVSWSGNGWDQSKHIIGFVSTLDKYKDWYPHWDKRLGAKEFQAMNFGFMTATNASESNTRSRTNLMTLLENGKLGLGTVTPANTLQLQSSSPAIGFSSNGGATPTQARIRVVDANQSGNMMFETMVPGTSTGALTERMRINANGNVGIGAFPYSDPPNQLQINGTTPAIGFSSNGGATPTQGRIRVADKNWSGSMIFETTVPGSGSGTLTERMKIHGDGGVSIGNHTEGSHINPGYLSVEKGIALYGGGNSTEYGQHQLIFSHKISHKYQHVVASRHHSGAKSGNALDFKVWNYGVDAENAFGTKHIMTLDGTGNVGIGVYDPKAKLHIVTNATRPTANGIITTNGDDAPFLRSEMRVETTGSNTSSVYSGAFGINASDNSKAPFLNIETLQDNVPIVMEVGDKTIMSLYKNQVIIGPNHPLPAVSGVIPYGGDYTLGVRGRIFSSGITCKDLSTWADYVFDDSYELKPLEEVADYVAQNKHLPDVPSAKEVIEKGIDVSEMLKIHMQKIEELTLYNIQMQKQIKELQQKLDNKR